MPTEKKVVIITSGQPSANPRVVKEATALNAAGYLVTVIYAPLSPWADEFDAILFKETPTIKWVKAGYHPIHEKRKYACVRVRRKFYQILLKKFSFLKPSPEKAFVLYSQELKLKARKIKADLYIAHNLGALPAAVACGNKWKAACSFDAEDYHRGESAINSDENNLVTKIENRFYPKASYITTASPLITHRYQKLFPGQKFFTVNNVFSLQFLQPPSVNKKDGLSLFWFSQTVGTNRGLETVIEAINLLPGLNITLHLLGQCSSEYKKQMVDMAISPSSINFIPPVALEQVFQIASRYDVGLATEVPHIENRNICLTNKIFTYLLASNCILASNTAAQKQFLEHNQGVGLLYNYNDAADLSSKVEYFYNNREIVSQMRNNSYHLAKNKLNWENESAEFLKLVESSIAH